MWVAGSVSVPLHHYAATALACASYVYSSSALLRIALSFEIGENVLHCAHAQPPSIPVGPSRAHRPGPRMWQMRRCGETVHAQPDPRPHRSPDLARRSSGQRCGQRRGFPRGDTWTARVGPSSLSTTRWALWRALPPSSRRWGDRARDGPLPSRGRQPAGPPGLPEALQPASRSRRPARAACKPQGGVPEARGPA